MAPPATSSSAPARPTDRGSCWRSVSRRCVRSPIHPSPTPPARRVARPATGSRRRHRSRTSTSRDPGSCRATPSTGGAAQVTHHGRCRPGRPAAVQRPWRPMIGAEHLSQLESTRRGRRPADRHRVRVRRCGWRTRSSASRPCAPTPSSTTTSAPTARWTAGRSTTSAASTGSTTASSASGCGRSSSSASCRATSPATRRRRCSTTAPSSARRRTGTAGRRWSASSPAHLVERYGLEEVRRWGFEVWNEANLDVFWSGTREEYLRLYDVSVRAVKAVDEQLIVGGPASAAGKWVDELLAHCARRARRSTSSRTHTYGNAPLDLRPIAARHGFPGLPQWWTEWGAHATHFNPVHDSPWSAAYLVRGMASAMGRTEALAYWTISDHFEELGRPPRLLHGGFGLLAVGNLRKPRWWGLWMLEQLLAQRLATTVIGDGAGDMVQAIGSRDDEGRVAIVAWNGTVDVTKAGGAPLLDRSATLRLGGLDRDRYRLRHRRLDETHSNLVASWDGARRWRRLARRGPVAPSSAPRTPGGPRARARRGGRVGFASSWPSSCRCHRSRSSS